MRNEGANNSVLRNRQLLERERNNSENKSSAFEPKIASKSRTIRQLTNVRFVKKGVKVTSLVNSGVCVTWTHLLKASWQWARVMWVCVLVCGCNSEVMSEGNERKCSGEQRDGERYHDWLRFTVRLRRVDWDGWEICEKKLSCSPPSPVLYYLGVHLLTVVSINANPNQSVKNWYRFWYCGALACAIGWMGPT